MGYIITVKNRNSIGSLLWSNFKVNNLIELVPGPIHQYYKMDKINKFQFQDKYHNLIMNKSMMSKISPKYLINKQKKFILNYCPLNISVVHTKMRVHFLIWIHKEELKMNVKLINQIRQAIRYGLLKIDKVSGQLWAYRVTVLT
jgi:hypothetical protein